VASTAANDTGGAIHLLQLISGRALARLPFQGSGPAHLQDLAVTGDGTVLILDSATPRILVRRPGAEVVDVLMPLMTPNPVSIAVSNDGRLAYVAHREGITRVDLASRRATPLDAGKDVTLAGFEFIRWHRDALVGSQVHADDSRSVVRLQLNRDRRTITMATLIEAPAASEDTPTMATISGDDLYYLVVPTQNPGAGAGLVDIRVRRITLK
jgi:sugar lactone lactonase YvrE